MFKKFIAAAGVGVMLSLGTATAASAVPISPCTNIRDGVAVPCVKRTWSPPSWRCKVTPNKKAAAAHRIVGRCHRAHAR